MLGVRRDPLNAGVSFRSETVQNTKETREKKLHGSEKSFLEWESGINRFKIDKRFDIT